MAVKGEMDMEKLKFLIMEEMEDSTRRGNIETEEFIKEIETVGKMLPVGKRVPLNTQTMTVNTFYNKMWALKKEGRIPEDLSPSKDNGKVYLVRTNKKKRAEN